MRCRDAIFARIEILKPTQMAVLAEVVYVGLTEVCHGWKARGNTDGDAFAADDQPFRDLADVLGLDDFSEPGRCSSTRPLEPRNRTFSLRNAVTTARAVLHYPQYQS
jgi:hypothetical protein